MEIDDDEELDENDSTGVVVMVSMTRGEDNQPSGMNCNIRYFRSHL